MENTSCLIIGAGIAGLAAGKKCNELSKNYLIVESNSSAGGLLDNIKFGEFIFDKAVHLSFATEPDVRKVFDCTPYITHPAVSYCYSDGIRIKHPIQNNLHALDIKSKIEIIKSFIQRPVLSNGPKTYQDWLESEFGVDFANKFPVKYTLKYWCVQPKDLGIGWIGNRMKRTTLDEILFGSHTLETQNDYYVKFMRYPVVGGYKSFIDPLIKIGNIHYNKRLVNLNVRDRIAYFSDGESCKYESLISSMPLPDLVSCIAEVPYSVKEASSRLVATSMDLVSVGIKGDKVKDLWFYIYDDDIYAARAYSPSVKSPNNSPKGTSSIQFEIYSLNKSFPHSEEVLFKNTVYALQKLNICEESEILFMKHDRVDYANVVFYNGMETDRSLVLSYLNSINIKTCGRFGEWDYLWSNQSFMSGYGALS